MKIMFVYGAFEVLRLEYLSAVLKLHDYAPWLAFDPMLFNDPFIKIKYLHKIFDSERILLKQVVGYNPDIVTFSKDIK